MKVKKLIFVACNLFGVLSFAQVGINTTTPNALLDIRATSATAPTNTDGLLIPKVDVFPATNPTAAQQGMLVYLTTTSGSNAPGFYYWNNPTTSWVGIGGSASGNNWALAGNTVNATTDFMGSTNDADVIFKRNNIQSGKISTTNTSLGVNSLAPATTRNRNTAIGTEAMYLNVNGDDNTAIGYQALRTGTDGARNVAIGNNTLMNNTTGGDNTAVGMQSLQSNTTGYNNVAVGRSSLYSNTSGSDNSAFGTQSLQSNTTGNSNVAVGRNSLYQNTSGNNNSASGASSLHSNTTGNNNSASGASSLQSNTTGFQNTASGTSSLQSNTTGSNNTGLGYNSQTGANLTNATAIGANASATTSNSLVLGSINGVNGATASANVGIGTTAPTEKLHVVGNIRIVDGNEAAGRVLTSDANGKATWASSVNGPVMLKGVYVPGSYANQTKHNFDLQLGSVNSDKTYFILSETVTSNPQAVIITGIQGGVDGRIITIVSHQQNFGIQLQDSNTNSAVGNRINTLKFTGSTSLQINNKGYVTLMYQISDGKWHVIDYRIGQP